MTTKSLPSPRLPDKQTRVPTTKRKDGRTVLRGRTTLPRTGVRLLRTELLPRNKADLFKAALLALPHTQSAQLCRDHHQVRTDTRFYVRWSATAPAEPSDTPTSKLWRDLSVERAVAQADEMQFIPMSDAEGWWYCIHIYPEKPGKQQEPAGLYEVHQSLGCNCPHYLIRLQRLEPDVPCKHMVRLGMEIICREAVASPSRPLDTVGAISNRRARVMAERDLDF